MPLIRVQGKTEKGEKGTMANNINGIFGYGYGVRYLNNGQQNKELTEKSAAEEKQVEQQQTANVDPNEVLNFLASSSVKVETAQPAAIDNNAETQERVEGYIQNFEMIYSVVAQEFGEDVANTLLNDDQFVEALMG